jgi:hypothetical protein
MAEVKRVPEWIMLEALRNNVLNLYLEKSDGTYVGVIGVDPADFAISTQDYEPVLRLGSTKTLEVGEGDTIMAIVLNIDDTDAPAAYDDADDSEIRYPIVDVDGNGETFPDGGSIDTTEFEVYLNDL